jgi:hypothetical protein
MAKFELTKSIEARKLNPRNRQPIGLPVTIPFGAILDKVARERDMVEFNYLGEPYQAPAKDADAALRNLGV